MDSSFIQSEIYMYLVLPSLIFIARIIDVTIGTIRIILVSKGLKTLAPILGFFRNIYLDPGYKQDHAEFG